MESPARGPPRVLAINLGEKRLEEVEVRLGQGEDREHGSYDNGVGNGTLFNKEKADNFVKQLDDIRPEKLAKDATEIWNAIPNEKSRKNATVICAALRDTDGFVRLFTVWNKNSVLCPAAREKAYKLGYHVIRAQQSHAEGQLLQFLSKRADVYTHLVAMGCDKDHCIECDWMMKNHLCPGYLSISGNEVGSRKPKWKVPEALAAIIGRTERPSEKQLQQNQ